MTRALVDAWPGETRAAVLDAGDALQDLLVLRAERPEIVGHRYLGRVGAYDPGLEAAFVDIGLERPALLPARAAPAGLREGEAVVVEVTRAPEADKGAKVTARLRDAPAAQGKPPRLLQAADPLAAFLRRHDPAEVLVDGLAAVRRLRAELPGLASRMAGHVGSVSLFEVEGLNAAMDALLNPEVPLAGGGRLRIEPVRTLTAIDVDAGGRDARGGSGRMALELGLAAADEIGRQVRLRALSGLIVIDFPAPAARADRRRVVEALKAATADAVGADVGAMRASGLVEMTRRRARTPLHELLTDPCGRGGGGRVKSAVTVAFELLRAAAREAAARPAGTVTLRVAPEVAAALEGRVADARAEAERGLGRPLVVRPDPARAREAYDVVLD